MSFYEWRPYVSVAQRRANAQKKINKLAKQGKVIEPVTDVSPKIVNTFWGNAWCEHLEKFSDYENRLPRGRTYVRNGSVCHLGIKGGNIEALVSGSEIYKIEITIKPLHAATWKKLRVKCTGKIGSALELLQGKFSKQIMEIVTDKNHGMFPKPEEIKMSCSCPDWAGLCKHLAAVMYGIGVRLDTSPELLFQLRGVDPQDLITADLNLINTGDPGKYQRLNVNDLSSIFGVTIDEPVESVSSAPLATISTTTATVVTVAEKIVESEDLILTGTTINELRNRFNMTKHEFALLLGVAPLTVKKWENTDSELNLLDRNLESLRKAMKMNPQQAQKLVAKMSVNR